MKISWRYKMKCVLDCVFASFSITLTIGASSWNGLWPRKKMQGPPPKRRQTLCGDTSCEGDCLHFAKFEENSSQFILIPLHSFRSPFSRCWGSESIFYVTACACKCTYDTIFYTYAIHDTLFASLFVHMSGTVNMLHLHSMGPTSCWSNLCEPRLAFTGKESYCPAELSTAPAKPPAELSKNTTTTEVRPVGYTLRDLLLGSCKRSCRVSWWLSWLVRESWRYCTYILTLCMLIKIQFWDIWDGCLEARWLGNHHQPRPSNISSPVNIKASRGDCLAPALWAAFAFGGARGTACLWVPCHA